ncbi:hypothetical protein BASA50_000809 [Batrachochytrium salamandrivorans]|uniref:Ataxin-10 homolog n=1 Tax=Batrachochytrium salamandrivorans TaxID=1357716 RepID=A0ABQ8EVU4_9FUNG|nr:hypothetical protein BASA50_000809 [Batrachochytrium salamandrivorans]KAH9271527.1 hypothetical protein BASA83_006382 [Batrachochytrium salamandrivorans]
MTSLQVFVELLLRHVQLSTSSDEESRLSSDQGTVVPQCILWLAQVNERLAQSPNYRRLPVAIDRRVWKLYHAQLAQCCTVLREQVSWERASTIYLQLLRKLFEWMRNICADSPDNQWIACDIMVHIGVSDILLELLNWRNKASEHTERKEATKTINMGIQALANMCTASTPVQDIVWPYFMEESNLLSLFLLFAEPDSIHSALVWIHNCTSNNPANSQRFVDSTTGADAVATLLNFFSDENDTYTASFELCYACIRNLLISDLAPIIWASLEKVDNECMSNSHVAILKALDGMVDSSNSGLEIHLPLTSKLLVGVLTQTTARLVLLLDTPDPQLDPTMQHFSTFLVLILQYIGIASLTASVDEISSWLEEGIAKSLIDLLHGVSKLQPILFSRTVQQTQNSQSNIFFMIRCDIMKVIANITFSSRRAQDEIRECDGIPMVLSNCVVDDLNPYLREYGLFAVRNLTQGNKTNQDLIASLDKGKVVPSAMLAEMGVEATIDADTGKLQFRPLE